MSTETEEVNNTNPEVIMTSAVSRSELSSITQEWGMDRRQNRRILVDNMPLTTAFSLSPDKLEDYIKQIIIDYVIPHVKFTLYKGQKPI